MEELDGPLHHRLKDPLGVEGGGHGLGQGVQLGESLCLALQFPLGVCAEGFSPRLSLIDLSDEREKDEVEGENASEEDGPSDTPPPMRDGKSHPDREGHDAEKAQGDESADKGKFHCG